MLGAWGQWILVSLQRRIVIQSWSISTGCNCCDEFSSVFKLVWPKDSTALFLEPWCCKQEEFAKAPQPCSPSHTINKGSLPHGINFIHHALLPNLHCCKPHTHHPQSRAPLPSPWFTVPPPAVSHRRCPRSQRCRWMGYWNQTPSCSGWMGFSCALMFAAKKWCRCIKHPVLKDSFQSVASLEQICDYILRLPYRELHVLSFYALKIHINTSKWKSDTETQIKNTAWIKGSSWHQMPGKHEQANLSSRLCCWQHPPGLFKHSAFHQIQQHSDFQQFL